MAITRFTTYVYKRKRTCILHNRCLDATQKYWKTENVHTEVNICEDNMFINYFETLAD